MVGSSSVCPTDGSGIGSGVCKPCLYCSGADLRLRETPPISEGVLDWADLRRSLLETAGPVYKFFRSREDDWSIAEGWAVLVSGNVSSVCALAEALIRVFVGSFSEIVSLEVLFPFLAGVGVEPQLCPFAAGCTGPDIVFSCGVPAGSLSGLGVLIGIGSLVCRWVDLMGDLSDADWDDEVERRGRPGPRNS